ncbi:hypothetical protein L3V77_24800 [Vibrio sp. DW001]|uniref:DUF4376 domain-containing protein n=1 Tax=Vibrio sp. DW001 TaxID=2912315 RepID=UPI0023B1842C|nr:hypothetical protein [Vibrio sp. DW001]WED29150.1 hypothetical protein L3V77_24800 [Vibrio sp. DW001]
MFALVVDNRVIAVNEIGFTNALVGNSFEFAEVEIGQICLDGELKGFPLDVLKAEKLTALSAACESTILQSIFNSSALGVSRLYRCRIVDQLNINGYVVGTNNHSIDTYVDDKASAVPELHTPEQCTQVRVDMTKHIEVVRNYFSDLKERVNAIVEDTPENRKKLELIAWELNS